MGKPLPPPEALVLLLMELLLVVCRCRRRALLGLRLLGLKFTQTADCSVANKCFFCIVFSHFHSLLVVTDPAKARSLSCACFNLVSALCFDNQENLWKESS